MEYSKCRNPKHPAHGLDCCHECNLYEAEKRIKELEQEVEQLKHSLDIIRVGPYDRECGYCLARIEKAEQALKGEE